MATFYDLLQHLEKQPDVINCVSLTALFRFINIATSLKDDIILIQPAEAQTSSPPPVLSPAFNTFLAAACSILPAQANHAWALLRHVIWHGAIDVDVSSIWENDARRRGFAEYLLYPPSQYCTKPHCLRRGKGMTLKKAEQRNVVLFTLAHGPCAARSVQLYCQDCNIDYRHNYTVFEGMRTYYDEQPETIQVTDHVFMEKGVVELFKTAMDVSWTSATNCARLYNMCLSQGKQTPEGYHIKFEITGDHVWDAFVITALLKDSKHRMHSLTVPQTGDQRDRFTKAMMDRNCRIRLYGYEDVCRHHCNRCTRMYANDQGVTTHKSATHAVRNDGNCSIVGCDLPVVSGRRTCLTPAHQHVEKTYQLRGQSRFQLQERLARSRVAHPNDAVSQDVEILTLHPPEAEEEYELNETGTLALPVVDSSGDPTPEQPTRRRLKAMFGRRRTHNEQLMVAPCGMIIARQTFFGAEGVASVKDFIKNVYAGADAIKPNHIFFDNNCTLSKMVKDDPFFEDIGLSVDVFHFNCKHSQSDTYCQQNCNPADYPELLGVISHTFALLIRSSGCQIRSDPIHRSVPDPLR
ncbi:hypothetical protein BD769DRAFT_1672044 [Suillus cothurnatus]|nr:hypothetical protein BD769DRAFT_1672044 [Suillus cothurnatus]